MSGGPYAQSDAAGGSSGTVEMPIGGVLDGGAHWRQLANAIEPSVCGGDASDYFDRLYTRVGLYDAFTRRVLVQ